MKIDFNLKTVEGIEVDCDNLKNIDHTLKEDTLTINLNLNDNTNITQTIKKPIETMEEDITPEKIEEYNLFKVEEVEPKETEDDQTNRILNMLFKNLKKN